MDRDGQAGGVRAAIYQGHVMHMRLWPRAHQFRYRVFSLLLDVDGLEDTCLGLRFLSLDRWGLLSFFRRDHGPRDGSDLRPWVEAQLRAAGLPRPAQIWLLSFPRILGYAFNPLSIYFCLDADGRAESVIYEVKNTFGEQHPYVLPVGGDAGGSLRQTTGKAFFVSPFIGMDQTYHFTIRLPDDRLAVKIRQGDAAGPFLIATQTGKRHELTDAVLLSQWLKHPLMTVKVILAIHWQALRLWLKGAVFRRYPGPYPSGNTHPERPIPLV